MYSVLRGLEEHHDKEGSGRDVRFEDQPQPPEGKDIKPSIRIRSNSVPKSRGYQAM
ncbi:MAG: hypothetical protein M1388_04240 [Thaumarchaeota archaeon]|nr:hypothetical protein [Nitrososphaerota archaeon]